jgi:hypothetical protein
MSFTSIVVGESWNDGDQLTAPKLNRTAAPTVTVNGTFSQLTDFASVAAVSKTFTYKGAPDELTCTAHGLTAPATADAVIRAYVTTSGTLPTGLTASTDYTYYVRVVDANTLTLHKTPAGALANTSRVSVTGAGSGTHTIGWTPYEAGAPLIYAPGAAKYELGWAARQYMADMKGCTSSEDGARGSVPQPSITDYGKYLDASGVYSTPPAGTSSDLFNTLMFY